MQKKDSKISFTSDIIKEVAKQLNLPETKIKAVYETQIMYLKHLVNNTDAVAIFIPFIGTLHTKVWYLFRQIEKYSKTPLDSLKLDIFLSKKKIIDSHIQSHIQNNYKGKSRHLEKNKINRFIYNGGKNMEEIEEFQNKR